MICTRCDGTGFLNTHQLPDGVGDGGVERIQLWLAEATEPHDVTVCDCCGNGETWHGTPGEHYGQDDRPGHGGPYAYNGGLCECN